MDRYTGVQRQFQLAIGQMVDRYRIESWLGEGAMGVVYRALDTHLDRPVAIKVLRPESITHEERRRRFLQEARAASALNHPNIITVYDIGAAETEGRPMDFIAMEYVEGKTLSQLIGRKGLRWDEALKYAVQMSDALAAAHTTGLVHRDLKPANIMVTHQGRVKVLDFGVAKLAESGENVLLEAEDSSPTKTANLKQTPKTEEGTIIGTVAYMSPEQAEGRTVDSRSDIFSFGSVFYEMLTGQCTFQGQTRLAILAAILHCDPKPVSTAVEGIPQELEKILARCLRKDQNRRFQHMGDVRVALQELKEEADAGRLVVGLPTREVSGAAEHGDAPRPPRFKKVAMFILAAGLMGMAGWLAHSEERDWFTLRGAPLEEQLAVLAFENVGGDAATQAFCDGLAETLASSLTQLEQFQSSLRVVPVSEVRGEKITSVRQARDAFGVSLVITGSVLRSAGDVRLTANLVDARRRLQLRSHTIRTRIDDLPTLQDRVIKEIVDMLEMEFGPQARLAQSTGRAGPPGTFHLLPWAPPRG